MSLVFSFDGYSIWFSTSYLTAYKIVNSSGLCICYNIYDDNVSMVDLKYIYIYLSNVVEAQISALSTASVQNNVAIA